ARGRGDQPAAAGPGGGRRAPRPRGPGGVGARGACRRWTGAGRARRAGRPGRRRPRARTSRDALPGAGLAAVAGV
ncbi:MAG: hypothetical protein AVDCRST_MAG48-438, partial [uncultured Friedmanniella sp.]